MRRISGIFLLLIFFAAGCAGDNPRGLPAVTPPGQPVTGSAAEMSGLYASSFLAKENNYYRYHPVKAFDNDPLTAWVEGAAGSGIDESISVMFIKGITADAIKIMPGYFDPQWHKANNRVKSLDIEYDGGSLSVDFGDGMSEREIRLIEAPTFSRCTFRIKDVYRGDAFDDTCIAEISFFYKGNRIKLIPDEQTLIIRSLPPGPNVPHGKKLVSYTMIGKIEEYLFPDGTYVQVETGGFGLDNFDKKMGTWKMSDDKMIKVKIDLYCSMRGSGKSLYSPLGFNVYEHYTYYEEAVDQGYDFPWQDYSMPAHAPWGPVAFILSAEYRYKERGAAAEIKRLQDLYRELAANPDGGR